MIDLQVRVFITALTAIALVQLLLVSAFAEGTDQYTLHGARTARLNNDTLEFESMDVEVEGDRIVKITQANELHHNNSGRSLDVTGLYLMPGLIDLHTHLTIAHIPSNSFQEFLENYDLQFEEPLERRAIKATVAAQATLRAGITTVRDLSTEGAGYLDVILANAIQEGTVKGPRVFPATLGLAATNGYMPFSADGRSAPQAAQTADTETELLESVRQQHANGAKWIKVFTDFSKDADSLPEPTYSRKQLRAITSEARRLGMRTAAHAYTDAAAQNCIAAGVDSIEHGFMVSEETMRTMRSKKILLVPTINGVFTGSGNDADNTFAQGIAEKIIRSGVRIGFGSDAGSVLHHGSNVVEIITLVDLGIPATEVLRAATIVAADVLGQSENLGQIEIDYKADIVAYRENPLHDIKTILDPVLVIKDGVVVLDVRE